MRKQSTTMSATFLPSQLEFEVSDIYTGTDMRWSLLHV